MKGDFVSWQTQESWDDEESKVEVVRKESAMRNRNLMIGAALAAPSAGAVAAYVWGVRP